MKQNVDGTLREIKGIKQNVDGTMRTITMGKQNVDGTMRTIYDANIITGTDWWSQNGFTSSYFTQNAVPYSSSGNSISSKSAVISNNTVTITTKELSTVSYYRVYGSNPYSNTDDTLAYVFRGMINTLSSKTMKYDGVITCTVSHTCLNQNSRYGTDLTTALVTRGTSLVFSGSVGFQAYNRTTNSHAYYIDNSNTNTTTVTLTAKWRQLLTESAYLVKSGIIMPVIPISKYSQSTVPYQGTLYVYRPTSNVSTGIFVLTAKSVISSNVSCIFCNSSGTQLSSGISYTASAGSYMIKWITTMDCYSALNNSTLSSVTPVITITQV